MTIYQKLEIDLDGARVHARAPQSGFSKAEKTALLKIYDAVEAGQFTEACQLANEGGRSVKEGIVCDVWHLLNDHAHGEVFILPNNRDEPTPASVGKPKEKQ